MAFAIGTTHKTDFDLTLDRRARRFVERHPEVRAFVEDELRYWPLISMWGALDNALEHAIQTVHPDEVPHYRYLRRLWRKCKVRVTGYPECAYGYWGDHVD